ncbi:hypothetical protein DPMN_097334 [Dreissena polymorpha]|uniref:Uncharacterized protein n=1 Tax=Dreissena polymorpha TaxID=45954 RepID=A0A9D4LB43_DREPO|nr:hypothetical protein DPMN_097334 [Dreissena polymorpha]
MQVQERQDQLNEAWNLLLEQIEARDQKLFGAGEIHRFNRDVEDALTRIQVLGQSHTVMACLVDSKIELLFTNYLPLIT